MVNCRPYYHWSILLLYIVDILLSNIKHFYISNFFFCASNNSTTISTLFFHYVKNRGKYTDFLSQD